MVRHTLECQLYVHNINYLAVVIYCMCASFSFVIIGVFRHFQSVVVECCDLLLMFSLFVTTKEFVCCVLDIVSVFAGKLVIVS